MFRIKLILISFLVMVLIISSNFQNIQIDFSKDKYEKLNPNRISGNNKDEWNDEKNKAYYPYRFGSRSVKLENNIHGGSWVDSFEDDFGVDWGMSDNIKVVNKDILIRIKPKVDANTVGLWYFDEGSGITAYDETLNNNDGILGGNGAGTDLPLWVNGKFGKALDFDGSDDYVDCGNDASLKPQKITLYAIVKPNSLGSTKNRYIVDGDYGTSSRGYNIHQTIDNKLSFGVRTDLLNIGKVYSKTILNLNRYYCVVGTYDGSYVKIYINGKLENSAIYSNTITYASAPILFGRYYAIPQDGRDFNGVIDEVWISNIARTPKKCSANITSKKIDLPSNMHWDTLVINKTQPSNTFLNVTILNASNNQPIPGSPKYNNQGEFDISYIDSNKYPSIKLNATFSGNNWGLTPSLHYWGVSWNRSTSWQDTFFGGVKVEVKNNVDVMDGEVQFQNSGTLRSKPINIPNKCHYTKLIINKTEPSGTSLKVSVLDAQSNNPITGYNALTTTEIDITGIKPTDYPSIKLKATYSAPGAQVGILHDWSINWTKNSPPKVLNYHSIQVLNRTQSAMITVNLSDVNENEDELILEIAYKSPFDSTWKTDYLTNPTYVNDHWECTFTPTANANIGLYSFQITCTDLFLEFDEVIMTDFIEVFNNHPIILDIESSRSILKRTEFIKINIVIIDVETSQNDLDINIKYKTEQHQDWESTYISNLQYLTDHWEADFTPRKNAHLGIYTLNVTCSDSLVEVFNNIIIEVKNNKPTQSDVIILPFEPKTTDDLTVLVANTTDIETSLSDIEYWYYWYRDDYLISEFENETTIPSTSTSKGEIWRCEVYPFDGDETGPMGEAEVIIKNSPPTLVLPFNSYELYEDSPVILKNKLMEIFNDPDNDILTFNAIGQKNITLEIIQENGTIILTPIENWFGTEYIVFYAHDSLTSTETMVEVIVKPTNDLPKITRIGNQIITSETQELEFVMDEDKWLNLTIIVEDIDGDVERNMVMYFLNITERANLYFDDNATQLRFNPDNDDVGWHYLNIQITDNNETPTMYISQNFKIQVHNANDPPTVEIISPMEGQIFSKKDKINFKCKTEDVDFLIPNPTEELSYKWSADVIGYSDLGTTENLINISLQPGQYNITVEVTDSGKLKAYDTILIIVKEVPKEKETDTIQSLLLAIIGIVSLIIIILIIFLFVNYQKKRRLETMGLPSGKVIQPDASYTPPGVLRTTPVTIQRTTPSIQPHVQPVAQLPSVRPHPQVQPEIKVYEKKVGIDSTLTPKQKIILLEERLLRGEIDQELFENLKAKYEFEVKPTQPPPRLPPV